jgi:hypothetical protein
VASSLITNHSQSAGGGWRFTGTEGNLSPLLYHGSIVGRPNTSSRDFGDPELELELSPLSPKPLGAAASTPMGGPPSPEKVPPHPLIDLYEEEAIDGDKEKKKKKKRRRRKKKGWELFVPNILSAFEKNKKRLSVEKSTRWLSH